MFGSFGAPRRLLWFFLGALSIVAVAGVAMGASTTNRATSSVAKTGAANTAAPGVAAASAPQAFTAQSMGTIDPASVPVETKAQLSAKSQAMPYLHGLSNFAALKAAALRGTNAPNPATLSAVAAGTGPAAATSATATAQSDPSAVQTPGVKIAFPGMADSGSTCKFFGSGCQPSDMAMAASSSNVVQAVNTSIAVYSPNSGSLRTGFPKDLQAFLGVPNPSPSGCASGNGAFLSDPRLSYDPNDKRFFLSTLEVEGAFGVNPNCALVSRVWIAVSATSNPASTWHVYVVDWRFGNTGVVGDFDMLGFNQQAVVVSGDMFNTAGTALVSNVVFSLNKAAMEAGAGTGGFFFTGLTANSQVLQDIQPVQSDNRSGGPTTEYLVNSFAGGGNSVVLWSFANPLGQQSAGPRLTGVIVGTAAYSVPPNADNAGACQNCIDTNDSRISSQPVYHAGRVYAALPTAINNGTTTVSGIYWFILRPALDQGSGSCTLCVSLTGSSRLEEHNYYFYGGRSFAYFPSTGVDDEGNMELLFNFSGSGFAPSVAYALKRVDNNPGVIPGSGIFLIASTTATGDSRWGDYSQATWTGPDNNTIWFGGEYSNGDWATEIGQVGLPITSTTVATG
jgi:hypothetical protein